MNITCGIHTAYQPGCLNCAESKRRAESFAAPAGLDDALHILINIADEYIKLHYVMITMPEHQRELSAGIRFMDALENLRDELLKRKSSNTKGQR